MVYKFVSRATADMIMLEADAQKILKIIGKDASPARKKRSTSSECGNAPEAAGSPARSDKRGNPSRGATIRHAQPCKVSGSSTNAS